MSTQSGYRRFRTPTLAGVLVCVALLGAGFYWWIQDAPRRESLVSLTRLDAALHSSNRGELLDLVILPPSVRSRGGAEQSEFLAKALNDEISPEGLAVLKARGDYGPLKELFPAEADAWCAQAGVRPDDCVAFKLERNGVRAEVVLIKPPTSDFQSSSDGGPYRIVRLNNVKQMANLKPVTAEKNP